MPRKKIEDKDIEKKILEILENAGFSMSIKRVTEELEKQQNIRLSPQVVKRKLEKLEKEKKIYILKKNGS